MTRLPSMLAALAMAASAWIGTAQADSAPVRATYDVYFGGLYVLRAHSEFRPNPDGYTVSSKAESRGILEVFFDWEGETLSEGRFEGQRAIPTRHRNIGRRGDRIRSVELVYDADGAVVTSTISPPPDPDEVTELPDGAEIGTMDPLSVIAQLARSVALGGTCAGEFAVYDGRRRYDLRVTDKGPDTLPESRFSIFSGDVMACGVEYALLGGQRKEQSKYAKTARERVVFVGRPIAGGPALPVGMKIETAYGTLMAHLADITVPNRFAQNAPE